MKNPQVKACPWELEPWVLAFKVRTFRVGRKITRNEFARRCEISERTLRKIEGSVRVRDLTVVKLYDVFPEIFEVES